MSHRNINVSFYTLIIGLFCLSFAYNIHLYNRINMLENSIHFTRCNTSEYEFRKLQDEIKRLENNPFLKINSEKSVIRNKGA